MSATTALSPRRTASRARRREQLIRATMKCIARKGLGNTTLADVAGEAGLSQGIVNLHFDSKDNLLRETLRTLANEYREQFDLALANAPADPAAQLRALMALDLKPSICDRRKLAVWFAFWGEVQSMPTYRRLCSEFDRYYDEVVKSLCERLIRDGKYANLSAASITMALGAITNGLWLAHLTSPSSWDRHAAMRAVDSYLAAVFPQHFHHGATHAD